MLYRSSFYKVEKHRLWSKLSPKHQAGHCFESFGSYFTYTLSFNKYPSRDPRTNVQTSVFNLHYFKIRFTFYFREDLLSPKLAMEHGKHFLTNFWIAYNYKITNHKPHALIIARNMKKMIMARYSKDFIVHRKFIA